VPTIRDLVATVRQFEGVEAALVLGRDGLVIDSATDAGVDAEGVAARVPSILQFCDELGQAAAKGALRTAIVELDGGLVVLSAMSAEVLLLVLLRADANVGALLYDLRRHRSGLAALV
jgi:predicted regulator of Ras-like GTPase activity (Roadblock/LC7/MglB family)